MGHSSEDGVAAAIERYYNELDNRRELCTGVRETWCEEETKKLFELFLSDEFAPSKFGRSEKNCTIHFFDVLGMDFKSWGSSLEEGIAAVAEAYHKRQTSGGSEGASQ